MNRVLESEPVLMFRRVVLGWREGDEPSRLYGKLTAELGGIAILGGLILNREIYDAMGFDKAAAWSGYLILIKGALEYRKASD